MMNIFCLIKEIAIKYENHPALTIRLDNGKYRSYTYEQLMETTRRYSLRLIEAGIKKGDRVAIIAENSPEYVISFLSIISIDCTAVLIDPALAGSDLIELVEASDVRGIMMSPKVRQIFSESENFCVPTFDIFNQCAAFKGDMNALSKDYPPTSDPDQEIVAILYSSGTTSSTKGVMHRHEGILFMTIKNIETFYMNENDRLLAVVPIFHIYGFIANMMVPLLAGASVCFLESIANDNLLKAFAEFKPTSFCCVPRVFDLFKSKITDTIDAKGEFTSKIVSTMMAACLFVRLKSGINLGQYLFRTVHNIFGGKIKGFMSAGTPLDYSTSFFYFALGFNLFNVYGTTETNAPVATGHFEYYALKTNGKPLQDIYISIKDPDENGIGEVITKTPAIMKGYFRDEKATQAAFINDDWFLTGDTGYLDQAGDLIVTGRSKENIILATGKKAAPYDIEKHYEVLEGVSEFVVCGINKNNNSFDEIHAFIVKDETCDAVNRELEAAILNISSSLPPYMRISRIHFVNEIPKTSLQKPKRYLLKNMVLKSNPIPNSPSDINDLSPGYENHADTFDLVFGIVSRLNFSGNTIFENSRLFEDLGFDSLSATELCLIIEKETGKDVLDLLKPNITVGEIAGLLDEVSTYRAKEKISEFPHRKGVFEKSIFSCVSLFSKLFYNYEIKGIDNLPAEGGYILCPNHQTHFDGLWILMHLPRGHFHKFCCMAKKEHLDNPFGRIMIRVAGGIPVDRYGNTGPAYRICLEQLEKGSILLVHPEGTRTNDGVIGEFKNGASKLSIQSKVPIVPVRIGGGYEVFPKDRFFPRLLNINPGSIKRYRLTISFDKPLLPESENLDYLTGELKKRVVNL